MTRLGTVHAIRRHPVKSLRGEDLVEARVGWSGIQGDRVYAFVQPEKGGRFPWLTAREHAEMLRYVPRFVAPLAAPNVWPARDELRVRVTTPEGDELDVEALAAHMAARFGREVTLRFSEAGMHDAQPLSVLGLGSVSHLSAEAGVVFDHRRFRANLVVAWDDPSPRFEDTLLGQRLAVGGEVVIAVTQKDSRCVMTNLDPDDAHADKAVFATIAREGRGFFGVYAAVIAPGVARVGDEITAL